MTNNLCFLFLLLKLGSSFMSNSIYCFRSGLFPDVNTPNKLFNGIPFKEIPIIDVKCSPNNTIMTLSKHDGAVQLHHSCGTEGFKHARKATNIAAQATAISLSSVSSFKIIRLIPL